jgi:autotransporter-associated beta strand protein
VVSTNGVTLNGAVLTVNTVGTTTINAPIVDGVNAGSGSLAINTALTTGNVVLKAANTFTGNTIVNAGSLTLVGNGTLANTAEIDLVGNIGNGPPFGPNAYPGPGGQLILDNLNGNGATDRISDNAVLAFKGGTFTDLGPNGAATSETIGSILVASGQSYLQMVPGAGSAASVTLTAASINRNVGATIDFSGPTMGKGNDQILFSVSPPDTSSDGIIPWATVTQTQPLAPPPDFATYIPTGSPRGITAFTNYVNQFTFAGPGSVVRLDGTTTTLHSNTTIGALQLRNGGRVLLDRGVTLTTTYGILTSGGGSPAILPSGLGQGADPALTFGSTSTDTVITAYTPVTLGTVITGTVSPTFAGTAPIHLAPTAAGNSYHGVTTINSGTVVLDNNNDPFGNQSGSNIVFVGGAISFTSALPRALDIFNPITFVNSYANLITGVSDPPINVDFDGTVTLGGSNMLAIPGNVTLIVDGQITGPGSLTLTGGGVAPGAGTVDLINTLNNYAGGTTLVGLGNGVPTLLLANGGTIGTGPFTLVSGTLEANQATTIPNSVALLSANVTIGTASPFDGVLTFSGPVNLTGVNQLTMTVPPVVSGSISGSGSWNEVGSAAQTGSNSMTAPTAVTNGTLQVGLLPSPASTVPTGLSGYWPFDGNGTDASGNGLGLTLSGNPGFATGEFNQALSLQNNGAQYAQRPGDDAAFDFGAGDFTIQVWANFNTSPGARQQTLIEKFTGTSGPGWTLTALNNGGTSATWQFYASPAVILNSPVQSVLTNTWYAVVVRRSGTVLSLFVNGQLLASATVVGALPTSTNPLLIGRRNSLDPRNFAVDGRLDDVAIWSRGLSNAEIANLAGGTQQSTSPVTVTQGTLDGTGTVGFISAGAGGVVQPGTPARDGILTASGANFSNGGTLLLRVGGYSTAGTDYDRLNLGGGDLVLGGTSRLVLDLGGIAAARLTGTATGVVTYGRLPGYLPGSASSPIFSEVDIINNPFNYTVELNYNANGLDVVIANGAVDVPVLTMPAAQNTPEDVPLVFLAPGNPILVADAGALNPLQVTITVTTGTLTLGNANVVSNVSGNGTGTVKFSGTPANVTLALDGLSYNPNNPGTGDFVGPSTIKLTAINPGDPTLLGGQQTATATLAVTVFPTADAPTFLVGPNESAADNAGPQTFPLWATSVQGEPPNTGNLNGLVFTASNDNPGLFNVQPKVTLAGNTGTLTFTPLANMDGVANVTVTLANTLPDADGDRDSFSQTFTITVINHNAPVVNDVIIHWGKQTASLLTILQNNPNRKDIPFQNITAIDIIFNEDVTVTGSPLSVLGQQALDNLPGGVYGLSNPRYLPNHTVEWQLSTALGGVPGIDKLAMSLASTGVHGKRNGKLLASNYGVNFNVLVGDVNGDGVVDLNDQLAVVRNLTTKYSGINFADIDGDGAVTMFDYNIVFARRGKRLP